MTERQRPLFSVVLLISGQARNLSTAVPSASVLGAEEVEIVAIDSSTSEKVHDQVEELARQSNFPVRVVRTAGTNVPQLWNAGASASNGRYLAFLDAEDEFHPDRLDVFRRAHVVCGGFAWGFSGVEAMDDRSRPIAVELIRDAALRLTIRASTRPIEAIRNLCEMFTPAANGNLVVDARAFRALASE